MENGQLLGIVSERQAALFPDRIFDLLLLRPPPKGSPPPAWSRPWPGWKRDPGTPAGDQR
jgi:hypothetical protein